MCVGNQFQSMMVRGKNENLYASSVPYALNSTSLLLQIFSGGVGHNLEGSAQPVQKPS